MEAKAEARYIRVSPQKARLVVDLIRGQSADQARTAVEGAIPLRRSWRPLIRRERITQVIVDASAIIAILRSEREAAAMADALDRAEICRMSAVTYVEAAVVIDSNKNPVLSRRLDDL